jgi:hypothetical protein
LVVDVCNVLSASQVPRHLFLRACGKQAVFIQHLGTKSGVIRVDIVGDDQQEGVTREEGHVPFVIVGRKDAVADAKMMLDFHLKRQTVRISETKLDFSHCCCFSRDPSRPQM